MVDGCFRVVIQAGSPGDVTGKVVACVPQVQGSLPGCRVSPCSREVGAAMKYGRLTVLKIRLKHYPRTTERRSWAICRCDCGKRHGTWVASLKQGYATSCGCLHRENSAKRLSARNLAGKGVRRGPQTGRYGTKVSITPPPQPLDSPLGCRSGSTGQIRPLSPGHSFDEIMDMIEGRRKSA